MNITDILFILSSLSMLVMWGWFTALGFKANRRWGFFLLCGFPISPFVFAYRFERKTRKIILRFIACLLVFIAITGYALSFQLNFFESLAIKMTQAVPHIQFSKLFQEEKKPLILPKPVEIVEVPAEPIEPSPPVIETPPPVEEPPPAVKLRSYQEVSVSRLGDYIGKKVLLKTSSVTHEGKLLSVTAKQVEIKKSISGGSTTMQIEKHKIIQAKAYL